jgi:transcriptional regulator NrdR family protein
MTCPYCGGKTRVIDCHADTDQIWRRRECKNCRYRFNTIEVDEDMYVRLERRKTDDKNNHPAV